VERDFLRVWSGLWPSYLTSTELCGDRKRQGALFRQAYGRRMHAAIDPGNLTIFCEFLS